MKTPFDIFATMLLRVLLACVCILALGSCQPDQEDPYPGAENFGPQLIERARADCEKSGGQFGPAGNPDLLVCRRTPADAGKSCTRESDCSTVCLARSRTCAPIDPLSGCNDVLTDSGMRVTQCVE